jgi:hypothetical protein
MFSTLGHEVVTLHRRTIGCLELSDLQLAAGEWKVLSSGEIEAIFSESKQVSATSSTDSVVDSKAAGHRLVEDVLPPALAAIDKSAAPALGGGLSPVAAPHASMTSMTTKVLAARATRRLRQRRTPMSGGS